MVADARKSVRRDTTQPGFDDGRIYSGKTGKANHRTYFETAEGKIGIRGLNDLIEAWNDLVLTRGH